MGRAVGIHGKLRDLLCVSNQFSTQRAIFRYRQSERKKNILFALVLISSFLGFYGRFL